MFQKLQKTLTILSFGGVMIYAQQTPIYKVESAVVRYHIEGGGTFSKELNLSIEGESTLLFREFGKERVIHETIDEVTQGRLRYTHHIKRVEKSTPTSSQSVDFLQHKIVEHPLVKRDLREGLLKQGREVIASKECDIWAREGMRICLYKGIPLHIEIDALGMFYEKKAFEVDENSSIPNDAFILPSFPKQPIALFKLRTLTPKEKRKEPFAKKLLLLTKKMENVFQKSKLPESGIIAKYRKKWLASLGESIYLQEKKRLPQRLKRLKKERLCFQEATTWVEADRCNSDIYESWTVEKKEKQLKRMEDEITTLEARMPCIRSAKDIFDLSECMR